MQPVLALLDRPRPEVVYGEILGTTWTGWEIDAQPFVMQRCRALFRNGNGQGKGKHTHNVLYVPRTVDVAKDLLWLMDRYPMEVDDETWNDLDRLASRYDRAALAAARGATNCTFKLSPAALQMAEPPREHQITARNLVADVSRLLVADDIGLGKTITAIATLCEPESRPALIVVQAHLTKQWEKQVHRFLPGASTHIVKGSKPYPLPAVDVLITAYPRLRGWQDVFVAQGFQTVIFDEIQDLRHVDTEKRRIARAVSEKAEYCIGLSATPIYNMGGEIWSLIDVISPGSLGPRGCFATEWFGGYSDKVNDPVALHSYLASRGLMLRRTKKDLGIVSDPVTKDVITLEGDLAGLAAIQDVAKSLAMSVLSGVVGESDAASRELDWKLRHATGVAKAKSVAEFVRMLVDSGEKVLLAGWHRDVYDVWMHELRQFNPVMYTGSESPSQKDAAVQKFSRPAGSVQGSSSVFICSLRSGAGLDGLQQHCSSIVFGELDWSPHVMDQMIGRLDREGQTKPVNAYYLTLEDGSDPFIMELLGDKRSQHDGIIEGRAGEVEILADSGERSDRIRAMAEAYLASIGAAPPVVAPTTGLQAEVVAALRRLSIPSNTERELQEAVFAVLPGLLDAVVEREVRIGERSRLDFLITRGDERIAIECKIDQTGRAAVYRQVRRYAEEAGITGCIVLAPWGGVQSFVVEGIPVQVVDYTKRKI